jgi:hypothetical protein
MKEFMETRERPFCKECGTPLWKGTKDFTLSECGNYLLKDGVRTHEKVMWHARPTWKILGEFKEVI